MAKWYLCKSLDVLRKQINASFPGRDKVSDGTVGDTSHKARKSSHNPLPNGAVRGLDITHNIEKGVDCRQFLSALLKNPDPRLWYIIFNGKIYNRKDGFKPRPYNGLNAHKHHLHISVSDSQNLYDDFSDWFLDFDSNQQIQPRALPETNIGRGAKGAHVKEIQQTLVEKGFLKAHQVDGDFGMLTERGVQHFQLSVGLIADGIVGKATKQALGIGN